MTEHKFGKEWKRVLAEYLKNFGLLKDNTEKIEIHCNSEVVSAVKVVTKCEFEK